ncbi:MAG: hypothetical protein E7311_02290 [Clostridiales bacterium]|nr:hypothetical protein [Clostridiales bacterium]
MQKSKVKLEEFLEKEMKPSFIIKEGYEERYKVRCRHVVTKVVNKVYEVLINDDKCIHHYLGRPNDFLKKELPEYAFGPCESLLNDLFDNYTVELFDIFETDLLDGIQKIKVEIQNRFIDSMLGYFHSSIISRYKERKQEIMKSEFFDNVIEYETIISQYILLINNEKAEKKICYNNYVRHLEDTIDEFIAELRRYVSHNGEGDIHFIRVRYIYYYIKENILTNF